MNRDEWLSKLKEIAQSQRDASYLLLVVTISTAVNFLFGFLILAAPILPLPTMPRIPLQPFYVNAMVMYVLWIPVAYYVNKLARYGTAARSSDRAVIRVCGCVPMLQLIAGIGLCRRLNKQWRKFGLDAGWAGPTERLLEEAPLDPMCAQCGYNLFGNISGVCSECGNSIGAAVS